MAHRDIKPANIFVDTNKYKLGDFGSACRVEANGMFGGDGTRQYLSPEMRRLMLGEKVEVDYFQSDIYSLGVTILHLGKLVLPSAIPQAYKDAHLLEQAVETETSKLPYSSAFMCLLRRMLEMNPAKRPIIEEVLLLTSFSLEERNDDTVTIIL